MAKNGTFAHFPRPGQNYPYVVAVLYYTSQHFIWWDFGGMTIQDPNTGGMDPNWHHPKPRPTTPQEFFDSIDFQYRKEN